LQFNRENFAKNAGVILTNVGEPFVSIPIVSR